ncbi:phage tail protein [Cupriavidus sp. UYPR2.512]|uniref:phage tail protein n=1 Tax=Cupriavidus sp. UYPR2.512 TaxID=1080187 RepID=UPI0003694817|nr:phage tail protein [Cupriavidus sp. UYPR2.512]UIF91172.1 phage tail protein [Cupriavidus necator]
MSLATRRDPLLGFNFLVTLYDSTASTGSAVTRIALSPLMPAPVAGFSECSGLEMSMETDDYMEGGLNGTVLKFPKRIRNTEIVLRHGVTRSTELFDWFYAFTAGAGKRKDGLITLCDARHKPHTVWGFRRGLPTKYSGPQLNAQQSAVAVEAVTITHEGLYQLGGAAALAGAIGEAAEAIGSLF